MNNNTLLIVALVVIIVAGVAYVLGHNRADNEPQGVLGNAAAAVSDKITQVSDQAKADADRQSASDHADAAKAGLGLK